MDVFYKQRYDYYNVNYAQNDILSSNGFRIYPNDIYNYFVEIVNLLNKRQTSKIMDVCCGNGLLLKHLIDNCSFRVIPFGIDFVKSSIEQAIQVIHSNNKTNFFCLNAIHFDFLKISFRFYTNRPISFYRKRL